MSWQNEMVRILRHLIDDLSDSDPVYSDSRLEETLLVAAQLTQREIDFLNTYTIDVDSLSLSPDPTEGTKDNAFINLTCLRAGCLMDRSTFRTKLREGGGLAVRDGSSSIDTRGQLDAYRILSEKGLCQAYADAKWEYEAGDMAPGMAIVGPFASPTVYTHDSDHRDRPSF